MVSIEIAIVVVAMVQRISRPNEDMRLPLSGGFLFETSQLNSEAIFEGKKRRARTLNDAVAQRY